MSLRKTLYFPQDLPFSHKCMYRLETISQRSGSVKNPGIIVAHSGSHSSPGNARDTEKRRSTRLTVEVPITVMGTDPLGEPFRETALTTAISCYGCNYRAHRYSEKNSALTLEIKRLQPPYTPRVVHARVVWVQRPRHRRETFEIGLALERPGNVWNIGAPPADWFPFSEDLLPPIPTLATSLQLGPPKALARPAAAPLGRRVLEVDPWQIRALPDPAVFHAALAGIMADIEADMRNMLDELAKTTAEALIADEIELIRKHSGGQFEGAIGETHRIFADLKAEIIQETHRICAEITKEMEDDLRRVIAEHSGLAKPDPMRTIAAKSPRKVREPKKRTAT